MTDYCVLFTTMPLVALSLSAQSVRVGCIGIAVDFLAADWLKRFGAHFKGEHTGYNSGYVPVTLPRTHSEERRKFQKKRLYFESLVSTLKEFEFTFRSYSSIACSQSKFA